MGKITVDLEARSDKWSSGIGKAERDLKSFVDKAQGGFKNLTFQGGATGFADTFAKGTKAAEEMATAIRTGAGYGEVFSQTVDEIPIVGKFKQAGEAIREIITGEKAAVVEAEKWSEAAERISDGYRKLAATASLRGKRGDERASIEIDNDTNAQITALHAQREKLTKELGKVESKDANLHWYSDAQKAEMQRIKNEQKLIDQEIVSARTGGEGKQKALTREIGERQRLFINAEEEQGISFAEKAEARKLKALGDGLKAREVMIRADSEARQREEVEKVTPEALAGLSPEQKAERLRKVSKTIQGLQAEEAEAVKTLQEEDARRKEELALSNAEKLKQIEGSGKIESLKIQDEQTNAYNEKNGVAARSHLADVARIEEDARRQRADAEKKYREDQHNGVADPELHKQELEAIEAERKSKLGLVAAKSGDEALKNQESLIHEQRKAWEQAGDETEKYAAHLADINEEYGKLHDSALRNKQIGHLDDETLEHFKKLNPSHQEDSASLYGRTGSFAGFTKESDSADKAQEQLDCMKKVVQTHADFMGKFQDVWNYFRKMTNGAIQEIQI